MSLYFFFFFIAIDSHVVTDYLSVLPVTDAYTNKTFYAVNTFKHIVYVYFCKAIFTLSHFSEAPTLTVQPELIN